jgi:hypothetical protein
LMPWELESWREFVRDPRTLEIENFALYLEHRQTISYVEFRLSKSDDNILLLTMSSPTLVGVLSWI